MAKKFERVFWIDLRTTTNGVNQFVVLILMSRTDKRKKNYGYSQSQGLSALLFPTILQYPIISLNPVRK
jgi:hypothetical protein